MGSTTVLGLTYSDTRGRGVMWADDYEDNLDALDSAIAAVSALRATGKYKRVDTGAWEVPQTGVEYYAQRQCIPGYTTYCRLVSADPPTNASWVTIATIGDLPMASCVGCEYGYMVDVSGDDRLVYPLDLCETTTTGLVIQIRTFYDDSASETYLQYYIGSTFNKLLAMLAYTKDSPL